jgi:hypothetical protein
MGPDPLIDDELAAFLQSGISMHLATAAGGLPQLTRGAGCRVSADRRSIAVIVARAHSAGVLADIEANGSVAAVFTRPRTHRTVQLKGADASAVPASAAEAEDALRQARAFSDELASLGYRAGLGLALVGAMPGDLVAVRFTPTSAFSQTPGPEAGTSLKGR